MDQTRLESFIESTLNTLSGFVISWALQAFIMTGLGVAHAAAHAVWVTALFTVVSLARNYAWRRIFANKVHQKVKEWVRDRKTFI